MPVLSAVFNITGDMIAKMDQAAAAGLRMVEIWERAGGTIDSAFSSTSAHAAQAAQSIEDLQTSASGLTQELEALYSEQEDGQIAFAGWAQSVDDAERAAAEFAEGVEQAEQAAQDFGNEVEQGGQGAKFFGDETAKAIKSVEQVLVAAGITKAIRAITDEFMESVDAAIEFESAVTGVYKTVDGTAEQLRGISDEIKVMAANDLPATTTEIAAVAEAAGQLGIATENITSFTRVMIDLGEATNLTSDTAASSLAKFSNVTQMEAQYYENLGSVVVALGNNFATTEADIVGMATNMASAGTIAGLTQAEIMALATAMSSVTGS